MTDANDITLYAQWDPNATASTVADMIRNMTESGTIAVKGSISNDTISEIRSALKELRDNNSNILVSLDLSKTTGIKKLEAHAFSGHKKLKGITIPDSVTSIGQGAFDGCSDLTSITIPSGVTWIEDVAFRGCSGLTGNLEIPSGVTWIGTQTFDGCSGLTNIEIPSGVTWIGNDAFNGCTGLTSIEIPSSVTQIGSSAFYGCSGLTSITIPSSVTQIGRRAFYNCSKLTDVTFADTTSSWYWTTSSYSFTGGTEIGPMSSDATANATLLTTTHAGYNLYKE